MFVGIYGTPEANPLTVINGVRAIMPSIQEQLPTGLRATIAYDSTTFIRASIYEVAKTLAEAAAIVIVVIFLFLGNLRSTFIPIVTIPLSLIGVMIALMALGYSIGMKVERRLPRKRKITTITIAAASASVLATSYIEARMKVVELVGDRAAGGQSATAPGCSAVVARTPLITVSGLPGHADEHGLEAVEDRRGEIDTLSELNFETSPSRPQRVAVGRDHQLAERLGAIEGGQRVDADLSVIAPDLAGRGGEVVGGERRAHGDWRNPEGRHAGRVKPDPHGEGLAAEKIWAFATPSTVCRRGWTTRRAE